MENLINHKVIFYIIEDLMGLFISFFKYYIALYKISIKVFVLSKYHNNRYKGMLHVKYQYFLPFIKN